MCECVCRNFVANCELDPVEINFPAEGSHQIAVQPASQTIMDELHPSYKKSSLVTTASKASRLLITTSDYVSKTLQTQADSFTKTSKPVAKPMTFNPSTHARIRRINTYSTKAAGLSATTVGAISKVAQNLGAGVVKRKDGKARGYDKDGNMIESYKPGVLNKSLMAFNTVIDGAEQAGRNLLTGTSSSMTTVVGHRWGAEAGEVSKHLGGGMKNVGLVYIDVTGVSRRAVLKSVAKGMVVGKVKGGGEIIVGGGGEGSTTVVPANNGSSTVGGSTYNGSVYGDGKKPQSTYGDTVSIAGYDPLGKKPAPGPF